MTPFFRLLRLQISHRFGFSAIRAGWRDERKKMIVHAAAYLVAGISVAALLGMYAWLLTVLIPGFQSLGMEEMLLGVVLLMSMAFVLFMGAFYLIGLLFFSKDTEFLAALPIPQGTVFAAKFAQVLLGEIVTSGLIVLPAFIVYGLSAGGGLGYWLRALLVFLFVPCIPLAISGFVSLLLVRFSALWRRRELLTIVGSMVLVIGAIAGQTYLQAKLPQDLSAEAIAALLSDHSGLLRQIASVFPPSLWAAEGLSAGGGQLLLFLGVSVLALCVVVLAAGRLYYRGAMAQLETAASQRAVRLTGKRVRRRGPLVALFVREWKLVLRSPTYALNGLITILMGPMMMVMPLIAQGAVSGGDFDAVFALLQSGVDARITLLVLAGLFALIGMINPAAGTTLSREGKQFYMLRVLPVRPARQAAAKLLFGYSVSVLTSLLMGVVAVLGLGLPFGVAAAAFALSLFISAAPLSLSMLPDILRPKLNWNSETEAIKQNINGVMCMLIGWAYLGIIGFGCYLAIRAGIDLTLLLVLVLIVSACLGASGVNLLVSSARRSFRAIEG